MMIKFLGALAVVGAACVPAALAGAQAGGTSGQSTAVYVANLLPMNANVTGLETSAQARFTIAEDTLTVSIRAQHVSPGIAHWQHFHGFKDGRDLTCPTAAADANHDGIIDLIETEPVSGTTMVPFDDDPAGMQIVRGTYPKASADGTYEYKASVSLSALKTAFAKTFGGQELDLDRRVVIVHGVLPATKLPASVASLGTVSAQITLPIACDKIKRGVQ